MAHSRMRAHTGPRHLGHAHTHTGPKHLACTHGTQASGEHAHAHRPMGPRHLGHAHTLPPTGLGHLGDTHTCAHTHRTQASRTHTWNMGIQDTDGHAHRRHTSKTRMDMHAEHKHLGHRKQAPEAQTYCIHTTQASNTHPYTYGTAASRMQTDTHVQNTHVQGTHTWNTGVQDIGNPGVWDAQREPSHPGYVLSPTTLTPPLPNAWVPLLCIPEVWVLCRFRPAFSKRELSAKNPGILVPRPPPHPQVGREPIIEVEAGDRKLAEPDSKDGADNRGPPWMLGFPQPTPCLPPCI